MAKLPALKKQGNTVVNSRATSYMQPEVNCLVLIHDREKEYTYYKYLLDFLDDVGPSVPDSTTGGRFIFPSA